MRSSRLLVVWVVVLIALAVIPSSTTAPTPVPADTQQDDPGTIEHAVGGDLSYLAINGSIERNDTVTVSQDAGSAVSLDTTKFRQEYEYKRIEAAHQNASDEAAFATDELDDVETRTDELRTKQNDTIRAYNDGELSSEAFLRELALISTEARRTQVLADYLTDSTDVENESIKARANDISQELNMYKGPVRSRIKSALNGDPAAPNEFFVRTTTDGVVLTTIDDSGKGEMYIREAYLDSARSGAERTNDLGEDHMIEKVNELYPEVGERYMQDKMGTNTLYRYDLYPPEYVSGDDGRIRQYVDRESGNIVFERQRITINENRTIEHDPQKTQDEQLALTRATTFTGGYMYVRLTHPEEGEPRNGTVTVDGEPVDTTDEEALLMLQPPNGSKITGTVGNDNVSVTVGNESSQPPDSTGTGGPAGTSDERRQSNHLRPVAPVVTVASEGLSAIG